MCPDPQSAAASSLRVGGNVADAIRWSALYAQSPYHWAYSLENRYPIPGSVRICSGRAGSASILRRS